MKYSMAWKEGRRIEIKERKCSVYVFKTDDGIGAVPDDMCGRVSTGGILKDI